MTSVNRNSKPDTALLVLPSGGGDLVTDVSQHRTVLTDNLTYTLEQPSTRTGLTFPRELSLIVDLNNTDTAVLLEHGEGAGNSNYTYRIQVSGGVVTCKENGTTRVSVALPGVGGGAETFLISWCSRAEGSDVRSELYCHNLDDGSLAHAQATHAVGTTDADYGLFWNGDDTSTGLPAYSRYHALRVGRRFHSQAEQREDWVSQRTPPSTTQVRREAPLVPDGAANDVATDGSFAGPAHLAAGHTFLQNDRRLVGPIVNIRVLDPLTITHTFAPAEWWREAPDGSGRKLCTAFLWCRPVAVCNRARVRVFIRQRVEVGDDTAEVRYRAWSIANLPLAGVPPKPIDYRYSSAGVCDTNHGAGVGEWLDLGALNLVHDDLGLTWLAISIDFDEDSELVADTNAYVHAVTFDPYYEANENGGGFDIEAP